MKQQIRYYISRKNPLTWISASLAVASVVFQVLSLFEHQAANLSTVNIWFEKVLPIWIGLGFIFILLVRGEKELYRSTKPVFWGCVYFGQVALDWHLTLERSPELVDQVSAAYSLFAFKRYLVACWILYLVLYIVYRCTMTGKLKLRFLLPMIMAIPVSILAYDFIAEMDSLSTFALYEKLSNVLLTGGIFVASLGMQVFNDGKYHNTWGDRPDGRRLRTIEGISAVSGYFMPDRNDACNNIRDTVEISAVERYIHKKRIEGLTNFGITHVFLAGYCRCVAKFPGLNRFFSGQRVHQHGDDIQFIMVVKKEMTTDAPDTSIKLHLTPRDTAEEVYHKMNKLVEEVKNTPLDSSFDNVVGLLAGIPGLILKFVVWCLKVADYFGKLPKFLLEVSPFHGSVIFTSMGSLGIPPVTHHLYNFGNLPVFLAFGRKYRKTELNPEGEPITRRYVDFVLNTDERTTDGFYYAAVLKHFHRIMRNPAQLDLPPEEVVQDID